jgi:MFS family permease
LTQHNQNGEPSLAEQVELMGLLFLHGLAFASWFVPLGSVLDRAGLGSIKPMAFAASAIAALMSPLFFGAMADRSVPPAKVFRWTCVGSAVFACFAGLGVEKISSPWFIWLLIQIQAMFSVPTSSLAGSIVFSRLLQSTRHFGMIRALGTVGWMAGCWTTSLLGVDTSPKAFYLSASLWILAALYTLLLPHGDAPLSQTKKLTLKERFGLDALGLLKDHDNRVVFITAALVAIPFSAFYPYTPAHLSDLGFEKLSAWMSLGQVSEVVAMVGIGGILLRWKLKWLIVAGLLCGLARYGLYSINKPIPMLGGLALHGIAFTFTHVVSQIDLAERIAPELRSRAQALLSLMTGGIGNLAGYLITGAWISFCTENQQVHWTLYWSGLSGIVFAVLAYFSIGYRGKS